MWSLHSPSAASDGPWNPTFTAYFVLIWAKFALNSVSVQCEIPGILVELNIGPSCVCIVCDMKLLTTTSDGENYGSPSLRALLCLGSC